MTQVRPPSVRAGSRRLGVILGAAGVFGASSAVAARGVPESEVAAFRALNELPAWVTPVLWPPDAARQPVGPGRCGGPDLATVARLASDRRGGDRRPPRRQLAIGQVLRAAREAGRRARPHLLALPAPHGRASGSSRATPPSRSPWSLLWPCGGRNGLAKRPSPRSWPGQHPGRGAPAGTTPSAVPLSASWSARPGRLAGTGPLMRPRGRVPRRRHRQEVRSSDQVPRARSSSWSSPR